METAARAAGIADPTTAPDDIQDEPIRSHPTGDSELGTLRHSSSHTASRASLPLSHVRSHSNATAATATRTRTNSGETERFPIDGPQRRRTPAPSTVARSSGEHSFDQARSGRRGSGSGDGPFSPDTFDAEQDDVEWGPMHPCFPHLNPHVPVASPLYQSTRVIRIKRDWMLAGDLAPTFSILYPEILDPVVPEESFRELVKHVNAEMMRVFDPWSWRAWFDATMGLVTGWIWDDFGFDGASRDMKKLEAWIERWNKRVNREHNSPTSSAGIGAEKSVEQQDAADKIVKVIPLRRTAYLCLDIQIPDPQITPEEYEPTDAGTVRDGDDAGTVKSASTSRLKPSAGPWKNFGGGGGRERASSQTASMASESVGIGIHGAGGSSVASSPRKPNIGRPTDDAPYGAYPVVPPIPGKFLEDKEKEKRGGEEHSGSRR